MDAVFTSLMMVRVGAGWGGGGGLDEVVRPLLLTADSFIFIFLLVTSVTLL